MGILSWLGRGILLTLVTLSLSAWVIITTLQLTLLDRATVLGWLDKSGAYDHAVESVISLQNLAPGGQELDQASLQQAISSTLTPAYIKQISETAINSTFDWLNGKTETIEFNIPVNDKRAELQDQLASVVAAKLEGLPTCKSGFSGLQSGGDVLSCLPAGSSTEQAADSVAEQTMQGSNFLEEPLTQQALDQSYLRSISWVPAAVKTLATLSFILPIVAFVGGLAYVLLNKNRLAGARALLGHIIFSTGVIALIGLAMWVFGGSLRLDEIAGANNIALVTGVVQPIVHQVLNSIGLWTLAFAASLALASTVGWIILTVISRKVTEKSLTSPPPTESPVTNVAGKQATPPLVSPEAPHTVAPEKPKPPTPTIGRM